MDPLRASQNQRHKLRYYQQSIYPFYCGSLPVCLSVCSKNVVWAYKGWFNWNIDHDWTAGVLVEPVQVVDTCTLTDWSVGKPPAPSASGGDRRILGIAFDKHSPDKYLVNCVTISRSFDNPGDCRHVDCVGWSSPLVKKQMTVAIYIR